VRAVRGHGARSGRTSAPARCLGPQQASTGARAQARSVAGASVIQVSWQASTSMGSWRPPLPRCQRPLEQCDAGRILPEEDRPGRKERPRPRAASWAVVDAGVAIRCFDRAFVVDLEGFLTDGGYQAAAAAMPWQPGPLPGSVPSTIRRPEQTPQGEQPSQSPYLQGQRSLRPPEQETGEMMTQPPEPGPGTAGTGPKVTEVVSCSPARTYMVPANAQMTARNVTPNGRFITPSRIDWPQS
jgi:hypothetical protein